MSPEAAPLRSILFFPGTRPELHAKGLRSGADAVCVDLEDAVAPDRKDEARRSVLDIFAGEPPSTDCRTFLRINDPTTGTGVRDLKSLAHADRPPDALLIPKVGEPEALERVGAVLDEIGESILLLPLIETAGGLWSAGPIAQASELTTALVMGGVDLTVELGGDGSWESLLYARSRVVHAAALGRVGAIDMPFLEIGDEEGLKEEARRARGLGFGGKLAIHPAQVAPINEAFTPSAGEIERARRIVDAFEEAGEGAVTVDGRMVDRPVVEAARRTLAIARRERA